METPKENDFQSPANTFAAVEPAQSPETEKKPNEWSKVRKLALRQLNRFVSLEPKVLKGDDPDAIHDMRVASRRLQQMFDLIFSSPVPREVRRLRRKLRRCRRALGDVRNCDVLLQQVGARLTRKRCSRREAWTAVNQYLQERRSASFSKAVRKLSKVNLALLYLGAKEILDPLRPAPGHDFNPRSPDQVEGTVLEPFARRCAEALVGVWAEFEKQVAISHREPTAMAIHGARLRAKRLRYLLEVVNQVGVRGSSEALAWLKKIQQQLGDWHDREVLEDVIIEMIAKPEFLRDHLSLAMATEQLLLRNRATKERIKQKYFRMTLDSHDYQRIREWVAGLVAAPAAIKAVTSDK
jgi:CHAD domain-containing protein